MFPTEQVNICLRDYYISNIKYYQNVRNLKKFTTTNSDSISSKQECF